MEGQNWLVRETAVEETDPLVTQNRKLGDFGGLELLFSFFDVQITNPLNKLLYSPCKRYHKNLLQICTRSAKLKFRFTMKTMILYCF